MRVKHILKTYKEASGQQVNFDKSAIIFSMNTTAEVEGKVSGLLGVKEVENHDIYLGLPIVVGKSQKK